MASIKEQLISLGVSQKEGSSKLSVHYDAGELSLSELTHNKLVELIIAKQPFGRLHSFLANKELRLNKTVRKKLQLLYKASIDNNFLDSIALKVEIEKIDFEKAKESFLKRKDQKNARKSGKSKKRKIKPYVAPPQRKVSAKEKVSQLKAIKRIGFGLESEVKIPKIKSTEVAIDKYTEIENRGEKSILYAAGWSLKHENDN